MLYYRNQPSLIQRGVVAWNTSVFQASNPFLEGGKIVISNVISNLETHLLNLMLISAVPTIGGKELREQTKLSNSLFSYHMTKLTRAGFVTHSFSSGCKFYTLTDKGRLQISSDGLKPPLTGLHNIGFKFKILKQPAVSFGKPTGPANMGKLRGYWKDAYFYRTKHFLVVRPIPKGERMPGADAFKLREQARDNAWVIAQELCQRYDMSLGQAEDEAKGEWATLDIVAEHMEASVRTPDAIIDRSLGEGEIDFKNPKAAMEYLKLPLRVAQMEETMAKMLALQESGNQLLVGYGQALNAHIPALMGITKVTNRLDKILSQKSIHEFLRK